MYDEAFVSFPIIETERLVLRQLELDDVDDMFEYAKHRDSFVYTDGFPHKYEELKVLIGLWRNEAYESKQFIRWGIELKADKKLIGGVYLFAPCGNDASGRRMDIGYDISDKHWNKGYASEAIQAVSHYGFTHMGLMRIQAQIIPENIASIRACEKAGFTNEGILRNYCHYEHNGNKLMTMVMMSVIPDDLVTHS